MRPDLSKIVVIDIETIRNYKHYADMPDRLQKLWEKKAKTINSILEQPTAEEMFYEKGGIYAEFGKVVVIAVGYFVEQDGNWNLRVRALANANEKELLKEFSEVLAKFNPTQTFLCGHNGKEFDFPYLSRRLLVNGLALPALLDVSGKKPWEVNYIDTMELWKFGDRKNYTSLDLLAAIFDIPSSKTDIDGSQVSQVFYEENKHGEGLNRIASYCAQDVVVTAQLYLKLNNLEILPPNSIHIIN